MSFVKKGAVFTALVVIFLCIVIYYKGSSSLPVNFVGTGLNAEVAISEYDSKSAGKDNINMNNWVSIAQVDHHLIIANYMHVIFFDTRDNSMCKADPVWKVSEAVSRKWVPTGVFYDQGKLYIANYKGENILIASIDMDSCVINIERTIESQDMRGPENVVVDNEGAIYSANYDSGTVTAFSVDGNTVWSESVPFAHGIAVDRDYVYASSLQTKKIHKIDKKTGETILKSGKMGWNFQEGEHLWPTSIAIAGEGVLLLSDGHSGKIGLMSADDLDPIVSFGGMGPGLNYFNYPYAAIKNDSNEIIVASSLRGSLYIYDADDLVHGKKLNLKKIILSDAQGWKRENAYETEELGDGWKDYINEAAVPDVLFGKEVITGYGRFHEFNISHKAVLEKTAGDEFIWLNKPYLYFLQTATIGNDVLIFSSACQWALLYSEHEYGNLLISVFLPSQDVWNVNGEVLVNGKVLSASDISIMKAGFAEKLSALEADDVISIQGMLDLYGVTEEKILDSSFKSQAGKDFLAQWRQCSARSDCKRSDLHEAALNVFKQTELGSSSVSLGEVALISLVSGKDWGDLPYAKLATCGSGAFYENYSPEDIRTSGLSHYISAKDILASELCFDYDPGEKATAIKVYWLNEDEIAESVSIIAFVGEDEVASKSYVIDEGMRKKTDGVGFLYSVLDLPSREADRFLLKVDKGGKQDRMFVRNIEFIYPDRTTSLLS